MPQPETQENTDGITNASWVNDVAASTQLEGEMHAQRLVMQNAVHASRQIMQHVGLEEPHFGWWDGSPIRGLRSRWNAHRSAIIKEVVSVPIRLSELELTGSDAPLHSFARIQETSVGPLTLGSVLTGNLEMDEERVTRDREHGQIQISHYIGDQRGGKLIPSHNPDVNQHFPVTAIRATPEWSDSIHRTLALVADAAGVKLKRLPINYS